VSPVSSPGTPQSGPPTPCPSDSSAHNRLPPTSQLSSLPPCHRRPSRKLVLELAVNLKGVSLRRYSPLGPLSPASPVVVPSSSQTQSTQFHLQASGVTSPTEPVSSSVKAEDTGSHFTVDELCRDERRNEQARLVQKSSQ